jgi:hypothetical protein
MRRSFFLALCALFAPLAPLHAADAYVPLATNVALGAATYRTLLIVTNTASSPSDFNVTFLPSGSDGSNGPQPTPFSLSPGSTLRLYNAVPAGARGMWALSGSPAIVVSARIEALAANGNVLASSQVPVFAAQDAYGPGEHAQLLSLEQSASGAVSDLGLMNFSTSTAHCTVEAVRSDAKRIANPVSLTLAPRSNNDFRSALATLGQSAIKDARFDVTCDQVFAAYAFIYRSGGPQTVVLGPAGGLDGDLKPTESGGVTFNLPGQFADGTTFAGFDLPLQDGVQYDHAHVEFDLFLNKWHQAFPFNPMYHNVASFRRSADKRADRLLYWGLILKGSGDYRTILDMGIPPGGQEGTTIRSGAGPWKERTTYHLVLDYDAEARTVTFEVYLGGTRVQQMSGPLNNFDISNLPGRQVRIDFSSVGIGDGAYFPTLGWKYSNLSLQLTPRGRSRN